MKVTKFYAVLSNIIHEEVAQVWNAVVKATMTFQGHLQSIQEAEAITWNIFHIHLLRAQEIQPVFPGAAHADVFIPGKQKENI